MHESDDSPLLDRIAAGDAAAVQPLLRALPRCVCDGWCSFAWTCAWLLDSMGPAWSRKRHVDRVDEQSRNMLTSAQ